VKSYPPKSTFSEDYISAKKFNKNPDFGGSRSFKIINVDTNKKLVIIACYDKQQHVCA